VPSRLVSAVSLRTWFGRWLFARRFEHVGEYQSRESLTCPGRKTTVCRSRFDFPSREPKRYLQDRGVSLRGRGRLTYCTVLYDFTCTARRRPNPTVPSQIVSNEAATCLALSAPTGAWHGKKHERCEYLRSKHSFDEAFDSFVPTELGTTRGQKRRCEASWAGCTVSVEDECVRKVR